MSPETSNITSEVTTGAYYGLNLNETELTLGLPGESRRIPERKRRFADAIDGKSTGCEDSDTECSDATKPPTEEAAGWPPVTVHRRSVVNGGFRFVKVAVDGAPYLRKVDLQSYTGYQQLQCALVDIFSYFTDGNVLNEKRWIDLVTRIKYVSTYEDKDGDWMLVGDVPWKMFVQTCKRIRLMRSSEAINGPAPRTSSKCSIWSC